MPRHRTTPEAYRLLHRGMEALAVVSENGMRIDRGYLDNAIAEGERQVAELTAGFDGDEIARTWRRRYREKTNFFSAAQMTQVVFHDLGHVSRGRTEKGDRESGSEKAFAHLRIPFLDRVFAAKKVRNAVDTFLTGIRREAVLHDDGCWYVHPNYGLNTTISGRSSADAPNVQNQPARNPVMAEMVRRVYIPRPGCQIIENDLGQIEARMPCPYTNDPVLMRYVSDPDSDMHRDMAAQLFLCEPGVVSKQLRQLVKGAYVFATFYGDWWGSTARNLWEGIDNPAAPIKLAGGTPVRDHLTKIGMVDLGALPDPENPGGRVNPLPGTWAAHVRAVDDHFWNVRFRVYKQWKNDWWDAYLRDGGFSTLTGFAVNQGLNKKQVVNIPIQGDGFRIVLRALPLINDWLARYKFKTRVICEIHDSVISDGPPDERDDVIDMVIHFLTTDVMRAWSWINVPIVAEAEVCPIDQSWYDKAGLVKVGDSWRPTDETKWTAKYGDWSLQCPA